METVRRMRPLLGTFVEAAAVGAGAEKAIQAAFAAIAAAQQRWSFQDSASELSRINAGNGAFVPASRATVRLLVLARALMRCTQGRFDITVGGHLVMAGVLPDHGGPAPLPRGCADDIELAPGAVRLRRPLRLTLDGIAKGYAVDAGIQALRRAGAPAGWVNAGGDLRVYGELALPVSRREPDGRIVQLGQLRNAAVATSLVASQRDDSFPALVIAPDGATAHAGVHTVIARSAWRADALAKVAAVTPADMRHATVLGLGGYLPGFPTPH
ncbi:FAD:protein FMN transferase [Pseudoduganella ginsengisoli]|uniref:FAD:protein FMN transferase n=1 Tax=Pseudoduganella ginsengisoli TaxID=1462440 RepID=A0A6L6Q8L2_9BURK|nr:FAD:protein FMN transferase [Pseudoduganella ginsengisoli]MTW05552.1 FAD:protein FMN transferase [Pseudoduganella ginsengisoli]